MQNKHIGNYRSQPRNTCQSRLIHTVCGILQLALKSADCSLIFLDGSYVTEKPNLGDFDGVWDPAGVRGYDLDPVFLNFENKRQAQKEKYKGEFFPNTEFVNFFQIEKFTGELNYLH